MSEDNPAACINDDSVIATLPRSLYLKLFLPVRRPRARGGDTPEEEEALNSADRFLVTVHASAEALPEYGELDPRDPPQVEDGPVLAAETVRRIACDCGVVHIRESSEGEPLDVGRKTRTIPSAIRRALKRRDLGCRFPGCVNSRLFFWGGWMVTTSSTGPMAARRN